MSQPSVTAYFNTRKRQATDELRNKSKVVVLEHERMRITCNGEIKKELEDDPKASLKEKEFESALKVVFKSSESTQPSSASEKNSAVRNIQFDAPKVSSSKTRMTRARSSKLKKIVQHEGQTDIKESLFKMGEELKQQSNVPFEKKGLLSPRKNLSSKKNTKNPEKQEKLVENSEQKPAAGSVTPKQGSLMDKLAQQDLSLTEIKNRINKSSRLAELRARIDQFKKCEEKLDKLQQQGREEPQLKIKKFEKIELEIPVSPSKLARSPLKTPTKNIQLPSTASPQRRLLFSPKETPPSPVKCSPTKVPAYQRYQSLIESGAPALPLPYSYRFLAEIFRCVDTVSAMLFNRKETITFKKLKPAVQELLRRNFGLEHLAQIRSVYPNAFKFSQEKVRSFGSASKEKYELVITPILENTDKTGNSSEDGSRIRPDTMGPGVMLERKRKLYNILLDKVKLEHEKFLLSLENPMNIPKDKITRWHPEFDVDNCPAIEQAELPQPPTVEKATSAQDVLEKAKSLFNCNTRMEKALQHLAESKMTSKSTETSETVKTTDPQQSGCSEKIKISGVDTPPATPPTQGDFINPALKGIPKALLERVRAKQAAKALEAMTRTPNADKEATIYSRLPEMSKILRNIFVAEKKSVLPLESVINKLDNSFRTKLSSNELEEHIRLMCKLLPTWASIHNVRKLDYLKIAKDIDIAKIVKRFEIMANDKIKA
ncbi:DNA replication factor Cdt1 [Chelonus insularis]|uniref:DNA replication factor Cdt1 n=1 Tax=Chelonus insularis TaxID=460826 RepID=UPI0015890A8C|nr:DNA replication factor Cdt1 [Chelonus insularis]